MPLRLFKHWTTRVAEFTQGRALQSDEAFLAACKLPDDVTAKRVALIVRQVIAEEGSVDPQFIYATDRYPEELTVLPSWDSIDWIDFIMRLEEKLNMQIPDRDAERLITSRFNVEQMVDRIVEFHARSTGSSK